jgi:hypothetical protein
MPHVGTGVISAKLAFQYIHFQLNRIRHSRPLGQDVSRVPALIDRRAQSAVHVVPVELSGTSQDVMQTRQLAQ